MKFSNDHQKATSGSVREPRFVRFRAVVARSDIASRRRGLTVKPSG